MDDDAAASEDPKAERPFVLAAPYLQHRRSENEMKTLNEHTEPQTEDSAERGYVKRDEHTNEPKSYKELGKSEELGGKDSGDIADETPGHRG